jgi:hypothetical protein
MSEEEQNDMMGMEEGANMEAKADDMEEAAPLIGEKKESSKKSSVDSKW